MLYQSIEVSVIVAISDHTAVAELVGSMARQTIEPARFELIIVDSMHLENIRAILDEVLPLFPNLCDLRFFTIPKSGRASANNFGTSKARGELLIYLADDMLPTESFIEAHLEFHLQASNKQCSGVGPCLFPTQQRSNSFVRWLEDSGSLFGVSFTRGEPVFPAGYFNAGNTSIRRELMSAAGGFDSRFPYDAWDDYELGQRLWRMGVTTGYVPKAVAIHDHDLDVEERRLAMKKAGASAALMEQTDPGPKPWHCLTSIPIWYHRKAVLFGKVKYLLTRRANSLEDYYRRLMDEAFVLGYSRGVR